MSTEGLQGRALYSLLSSLHTTATQSHVTSRYILIGEDTGLLRMLLRERILSVHSYFAHQ